MYTETLQHIQNMMKPSLLNLSYTNLSQYHHSVTISSCHVGFSLLQKLVIDILNVKYRLQLAALWMHVLFLCVVVTSIKQLDEECSECGTDKYINSYKSVPN